MLGEQRGPVPSSVQQLFSGNYLGLYEKNLVMFEFVQPTLSLLYHLCTIVVERNSFFFFFSNMRIIILRRKLKEIAMYLTSFK